MNAINTSKEGEKSDIDLIDEFKQGQEEAFSELVKRHKERAMKLTFMIVGNYEDAKDISQEVFIKTYRSLKGFHGKSKFSTWFYRILMNSSKDFMRKKKFKQFVTRQKDTHGRNYLEEAKGTVRSPEHRLLGKELKGHINQVIHELPMKQRWVFTLRFIEEMSLQEIADSTGQSEGTVKATLHFAVQKVRKGLAPYLREGSD